MRKTKRVIVVAIAAMIVLISVGLLIGKNNCELTDEEWLIYEEAQQQIDDGNSIGFSSVILEEDFSRVVFDTLYSEDEELVDYVMADALYNYARMGQIRPIFLLRINGFVSNECFELYWEMMGTELPQKYAYREDNYLIHEMKMAYVRDSYVLREYCQMRQEGLIDESLHVALMEALGFDYTNEDYLNFNEISPLRDLTEEEKQTYDAVLVYIDQGNCMAVIDGMLSGEITLAVYNQLVEDDGEVIEYVIAEGMHELQSQSRYQDLVRIRLEGFVSDTCFVCYWEMLSVSVADNENFDQRTGDIDVYLLREYERIYHTEVEGTIILNDIWKSGLMSDDMHQALIERLGADYITA